METNGNWEPSMRVTLARDFILERDKRLLGGFQWAYVIY